MNQFPTPGTNRTTIVPRREMIERMVSAGSWSVYWYNGLIISSEIARGLDIYELLPSGLISQNEIDAAKTVQWEFLNAQEQRKIVWPPSFAKARAYLDQLERSSGLASARIAASRKALAAAEQASGSAKREALSRLAADLQKDAASAGDGAKVRLLTAVDPRPAARDEGVERDREGVLAGTRGRRQQRRRRPVPDSQQPADTDVRAIPRHAISSLKPEFISRRALAPGSYATRENRTLARAG